jgi:VanZ family protein
MGDSGAANESEGFLKYLENHRIWRAALIAMLIPLGLIAFWPNPVDAPVQGLLASVLNLLHAYGMPTWLNYKFVEASANVLLFVPLGVVALLSFTKRPWWQFGVFGLIVSSCMELGQLLFLHNRFASPLDLVTNTVGALIGAVLASSAVKRLKAGRLSATSP